MVAMSITQPKREQTSMIYDKDKKAWIEVTGWRSWGCVTALSSYALTLAIMVWYIITGLIVALPFIVLAISLGLVIYLVIGDIR